MPPLPPDLPPPALEVFYSPTCTPCRLELPALATLAGDGTTIRIVLLDQEERARSELRAVSPVLETAAVGPSSEAPRDVLRAAGNANGILPFARAVTADEATCATWSGGLTVERARSLLAACARLVSAPRRARP
jgi:hypothetical protein